MLAKSAKTAPRVEFMIGALVRLKAMKNKL